MSVRLVFSHVLVALIGALTAFVVVRLAAPALFDQGLRGGNGPRLGRGQGPQLRFAFAAAVDRATAAGALAGLVTAATVGVVAARRILHPLHRIGAATRRMAAGEYGQRVEMPREVELARLAADVNRLGDELARTEATRVRLLGEITHEMRTPLTVIDGYAAGIADGVLPASAENLRVIADATRRLERLAQDLSTLSRTAEHGFDLRPVPTDIAQVVVDATTALQPTAQAAGVHLRVQTDAVAAVLDPDRLAQVVTNLVRNAIQATPVGGEVTVRTVVADRGSQVGPGPPKQGEPRVKGHILRVTDTGRGIETSDLERVFERFQRVGDGSGIGLTISREIVRAHGGRLSAASAGPGRGSTFEAWLPNTPPGQDSRP